MKARLITKYSDDVRGYTIELARQCAVD